MLSAVILYCEKDKKYLPSCVEYLPKECELVLVNTKEGNGFANVVLALGNVKRGEYQGHKTIMADFLYNGDLDMSAARNRAKSLATGDWILSIDPDEKLHPAYHSVINNIIENTEAWGVYVNIYSYEPAFQQENGKVPSDHTQAIRLFKNHPLIIWEGYEDETVEYSMSKHERQRAQSDISIIHSGYSLSAPEMKEKVKYKIIRQAREPRTFTENIRFKNLLKQINSYNYLTNLED